MASVFKLPDVNVYVWGWGVGGGGGGGGEAKQRIYFIKTAIFLFFYFFLSIIDYIYDFILLPFSSTVSLSVLVFSCDWN